MLDKLAEHIITRLKSHNILILRNDANSGSIYLTFDCGQSGFLRISDHESHRTNNVRFNLITKQRNKVRVVVPTKDKTHNIIKYYYPLKDINDLINDIINYTIYRRQLIGEDRYNSFCAYALEHKVGKDEGFWKYCKVV